MGAVSHIHALALSTWPYVILSSSSFLFPVPSMQTEEVRFSPCMLVLGRAIERPLPVQDLGDVGRRVCAWTNKDNDIGTYTRQEVGGDAEGVQSLHTQEAWDTHFHFQLI